MSSGAQVAVLGPRGVRPARTTTEVDPVTGSRVRLAAFAALAVYGVLRWGTLLSPSPTPRLIGLLALALVLAGPGRAIAARSRLLGAIVAAIAILAMFPICGVPLSWVVHVRIEVSARGIGEGLGALPQMLLPYTGINEWVRVVTTLGAGVLLLDAALMLCFAPPQVTEQWRAGAALPLVVLAVLPSTLARPHVPYVHGLILFALLAFFAWGDRVRRYEVSLAIRVGLLAGAAAMLLAPVIDAHRPWLNYQALAGRLAPAHLEAFDWNQRYGPLNWPRTGTEMLDVKAARPDYWKAQDLNVFDGRRWTAGPATYNPPLPAPDPGAVAHWSQTIQVTLRGMQSGDVIAAGFATRPQHLAQGVSVGADPGTWTASTLLEPGDSYRVRTYSPRPSGGELGGAGPDYPSTGLAGYRSMILPTNGFATGPAVVFAPFHSGLVPEVVMGVSTLDGTAALQRSPYARAYALAGRLAAGAPTPYGFVENVLAYLRRGFSYNENPPASPFPLETFLFSDKRGYCQQFSGAMALLLRMGGLPARVAAGFTTGTRDTVNHQWVVTDFNAHSWVEVWFPHYGWIRFDPTPPAAPARENAAGLQPVHGQGLRGAQAAAVKPVAPGAPARRSRPRAHPGGVTSFWLVAMPVAIAVAALIALGLFAVRRSASTDEQRWLAELERALARSGRPVRAGVTLAALERRIESPEAAAYVRAVRLARFGGAALAPVPAQRRALRAQLRAGLGLRGWLRAWWALPPWPLSPRPSRNGPDGS